MKSNWIKLDNAAKIFPAATRKSDTQVFRITCELKEETVSPVLLQKALDETIESIPYFRYVMKRGFFWYYLESSDLKPEVLKEHKPPCALLYDKDRKNLLFEVTHYNNRINLEVYHVLTDGTGALFFFTTLLSKYLSFKHDIKTPSLEYDASHFQMSDDSFSKYSTSTKLKIKQKQPDAVKLRGIKYPEHRLKLISGVVSVKQLHTMAKNHNATISVYLCALLMQSIAESTSVRAKKKPVTITIPVNLRNVFPSQSARNFFSVFPVSYNFSTQSGELDDIIKTITNQFEQELTQQHLIDNMNTFFALEHNPFSRFTPLFVKNIVLGQAYKYSRKKASATLSNVGVIKMPVEISKFIEEFHIFTSTDSLQACVCSFEDKLSVGFTSPLVNADVQRHFFRTLNKNGIDVELSANGINEDS